MLDALSDHIREQTGFHLKGEAEINRLGYRSQTLATFTDPGQKAAGSRCLF